MTFDQATAIISRPGNHSVANVRAAVRAIVQMNKPDYADGWPLGWGLVQQKLDAALLTAGKFADAYPLGEKWDAASSFC